MEGMYIGAEEGADDDTTFNEGLLEGIFEGAHEGADERIAVGCLVGRIFTLLGLPEGNFVDA